MNTNNQKFSVYSWLYSSLTLLFFSLISCADNNFKHTIATENKPWTHQEFDADEDKFSFAIFSDITGGERPEVFKVAIEQLNLLRPEFILNVGDLVEGADDDSIEWNKQWEFFKQRANKALAPIFYMGGNHDLTGQVAKRIWEEQIGPSYYHFRYKDVLFLVLDTEDYSAERMEEMHLMRQSAVEVFKKEGYPGFAKTAYAKLPEMKTGRISAEQSDYFINAIANNSDVRWTFVLIHKPVWEKANEENFAAIETALETRPYTVFNGHTHVYKYQKRNNRDYINLATTGGYQATGEASAFDHVMWVTVDKEDVIIANLKLSGILNKSGNIPLQGDTLKFE